MAVRKHRTRNEWTVFAKIDGKLIKLTTVGDSRYAHAISDFAERVQSPYSDEDDLSRLEVLSNEAAINLQDADQSCSKEVIRQASRERSKEHEDCLRDSVEFKAAILLELHIQKLGNMPSVPAMPPRNSPYPEAPPPTEPVDRYGSHLPQSSGVYFAWSNGFCEYVGQSINLSKRVKLTHERLLPTDMISYLLFDPIELMYAESYYIGIMRPQRNFGKRIRRPEALEETCV